MSQGNFHLEISIIYKINILSIYGFIILISTSNGNGLKYYFINRLDPGATQNRAKLLLEKNKADLNMSKLDYEAGKITRDVFMARIKDGVRVEVNAKKILYFKWED